MKRAFSSSNSCSNQFSHPPSAAIIRLELSFSSFYVFFRLDVSQLHDAERRGRFIKARLLETVAFDFCERRLQERLQP